MPKPFPGRGREESDVAPEAFSTDEVTGLSTYQFSDKVKSRFVEIVGRTGDRPTLEEEHRGIFPGLMPGDYFTGQLPTVIRRLSLDQLSALYSLFGGWYRYLAYQTNLIAAERSEALRQKEFLWARIRQQFRVDSDGKKNSAQTQSDLARKDYRYVKASAHYEELNSLYSCMLAALEVAHQDMKVISREVTIHQAKLEAEYMGNNMGNRLSNPFPKPFRSYARPEVSNDDGESDSEQIQEEEEPTHKRRVGPRIFRQGQ
jgi:hypothetical protein